jgi:hypothetical protein
MNCNPWTGAYDAACSLSVPSGLSVAAGSANCGANGAALNISSSCRNHEPGT